MIKHSFVFLKQVRKRRNSVTILAQLISCEFIEEYQEPRKKSVPVVLGVVGFILPYKLHLTLFC